MRASEIILIIVIVIFTGIYIIDRKQTARREEAIKKTVDGQTEIIERYELQQIETVKKLDSLTVRAERSIELMKSIRVKQERLHKDNEKLFDKYSSLVVTRPEF